MSSRRRAPSPYAALARLESLSPRGMKLGLDAIGEVCERLGHPERRVPTVLVAGTNGKGSTAATLSAIAKAGGRKAGLYTSPHLLAVTERIRLDDADVAEGELDEALAAAFSAADRAPGIPLTYFEALTAAAFWTFADRRVALAVLEVGLGGRFDATNVAPASLSAVTSISLDHTQELGPTVADIAREKAGVFRRDRPALVDASSLEARDALRAAARVSGAILHEMGSETEIDVDAPSLKGVSFRLRTPVRSYALMSPLPGAHQARNAAIAVRAAELLAPDVPIAEAAISKGIAAVRWPGRLERLCVRGRDVLLDGCHNPAGAEALARFLEAAPGRASLVFGAMADKDVESMMRELGAAVGEIRLVSIAGDRAAPAEELRRRIRSIRPDAAVRPSLEAALDELLSEPGTAPIIVAGSLYLVGEARAALLSRTEPGVNSR